MTDRELVEAHWEDVDLMDHTEWSAAAEFTRNRLEEIRQLEREIEWADDQIISWKDWGRDITSAELARIDIPGYRIIARLQRELAALKQDMKDGASNDR